MCLIILSSLACVTVPHLFTLSQEQDDFWKRVIEHKICCDTVYSCYLKHVSLRISGIWRNININILRSWCKLSTDFRKTNKNSQNAFPVVIELFHVDRRTDGQTDRQWDRQRERQTIGQTDVMKLIVAFRDFGKTCLRTSEFSSQTVGVGPCFV